MIRAKESLAEEDGVFLGYAWRSILLFALWMDLRACANFGTEGERKMFEKYLLKRERQGFMCHAGWVFFITNLYPEGGE